MSARGQLAGCGQTSSGRGRTRSPRSTNSSRATATFSGGTTATSSSANGKTKATSKASSRAAARRATAGVQQAFAMDAAAFKDVWNGQFGTLSFKDPNNKIVHVATMIQAKKNADMYINLLAKAMEFPELRNVLNNPNTTCFTDKHKGSDAAVPKVCPLTEDRQCVEHLIKLVGAIGHNGRYHVYKAAKAATKALFDRDMNEVKKLNSAAFTKLDITPHNT
ncbi:unnamed protein product [Ectocarpus sp. 4 AP-2014]